MITYYIDKGLICFNGKIQITFECFYTIRIQIEEKKHWQFINFLN